MPEPRPPNQKAITASHRPGLVHSVKSWPKSPSAMEQLGRVSQNGCMGGTTNQPKLFCCKANTGWQALDGEDEHLATEAWSGPDKGLFSSDNTLTGLFSDLCLCVYAHDTLPGHCHHKSPSEGTTS